MNPIKKTILKALLPVTILFFSQISFAQSINIDSSIFVSGQYGRSSGIAVPFNLSGTFEDNNAFQIFLSDSSGDFTNELQIGLYNGFFALFTNGTIPSNAIPGSNYKVRVKSTNPVMISNPSVPFSIIANAASQNVKAKTVPLSSNRILTTDYAFGWCKSPITSQTNFTFLDQSTTGAEVKGILKNQITKDIDSSIIYTNAQTNLNLERYYYTYILKAQKNGILSTKAYIVVNSPNRLQLATEGEQQGCIPDTMQFQIGIDAYTGGIGENYPGIKYKVSWGDGANEIFHYDSLVQINGLIKHSYSVTSCTQAGKTYNITISALVPWNAPQGCETPMVTTKARIFKKPVAAFTFDSIACINTNVKFSNISDPGQASFGTTCTINADYFWFVDGVAVAQQMNTTPSKANLTYKFTTTGKHYIKLLVDNGSCLTSEFIDSICIDEKPLPAFTINNSDSIAGCAPLNFTPLNQSNQGICQPYNYLWKVKDVFANEYLSDTSTKFSASDLNQINTDFSFLKGGKYELSLQIKNACGTFVSDTAIVRVIPEPEVALPADQNYCGPITIDFSNDSLHKPQYNSGEIAATYQWVVTGGNFSFENGSSASSAYPQIIFKDHNVYDVKLIYSNACGFDTAFQKITISQGFQSVGGYTSGDKQVCFGLNTGNITLTNFTGNILFWQTSADSGATWTNVYDTVSSFIYNNLITTTWVRAIVKNGNCNPEASSVSKIIVLPELTPTNAGPDQALCFTDNAGLSGNQIKANETGTWQQIAGPNTATIADINNPSTTLSNLVAGVYSFSWNISNSVCSASDTAVVKIYPALINQIDTASEFVCYGAGVTIKSDSLSGGSGSYEFIWQSSTDGITWNSLQGANQETYFFIADTTLFFRRIIVSDNCTDTSESKLINVSQAISQNVISGNQTICENNIPNILSGNIPNGGNGNQYLYQWEMSLDNQNWTFINGAVNLDYQPAALTATTYFRRKVTTQLCSNVQPNTSNTIMIEVTKIPVASFNAVSYEGCSPLSIDFKNQNIETGVQYTWQFGDGASIDSSGAIINHVFHSNKADTFTVRLIAQNSCGSDTAEKQVIIKKFEGYFEVSDSTGNCLPYEIVFTNKTSSSSSATWNFGDGTVGSGNIVSHSYTSYGTYNATLTAQSGNCSYEYTKQITIQPSSGSWSYTGGTSCNTEPVKFQIVANNIDSIKIFFGDGTSVVTNDKTVYHHYNKAGNYLPTAVLFAGQNGNCTITLHGTDTIKADVVKAGFSYSETIACGVTTVNFLDTSKSQHGIASWKWNFGDGKTGSGITTSNLYKTSNNWPVKLMVTSFSGCKDTITLPVNIVVHENPVAHIIADSVSCQESPINYHASVEGNDPATIFQWQFSNGLSGSTQDKMMSYSLAGNYQTTLIATTQYGCSDTAIHNIKINPKPDVKTIADEIICKGSSIQLAASGALTYRWSPMDNLSCVTCPNPIAKPGSTTKYIVTGTNANGCSATDSVLITVSQPINVTITKPDSICLGESIIISASGAHQYQWFTQGTSYQSISPAAIKINPLTSIKIGVAGTDQGNCFADTAYTYVTVGEPLSIDLGSDKTLSTGTELKLNSKILNGPVKDWKWESNGTLNCNTCPEPTATIKNEACYNVEAKSVYGCIAKDTLCVKVFCESAQVFIPNAFTPDGDGVNDYFIVRAKGIKMVKSFKVFDRWGRIVFERANFIPDNSKSTGWDGYIHGKPANADVYIYVCDVVCENDVPYSYKGNVAIIK